jgi:serine/threonine-protein kinase RsbW
VVPSSRSGEEGTSGHMNALPDISVQMLSRTTLLAPVRCMLVSLAEHAGFDEVCCGHIALAVDEALANVIRHGYGGREDCRVWIHFWHLHEPHGIRIVIEDLARQIEPETIRGRDLDDVRPGGLGVHLIRTVMDTTVFEKRPGGGMRLTLEKMVRDDSVPAPI